MELLKTIHGHNDLIKLNEEQRRCLCEEIRHFLVENVSKTGGHLASNLGVVELTVALETVFDTRTDRLVFDVGHQSYVHKLLTGRQADFSKLRQYGGIAGFPKPSESQTDAFVAGHASSSVSIALGMARARSLCTENYNVVALLGDGAATGGMVYEGLNDAAVSGEPMIVILNDNAMSIDHNVGGMASHLSKLRTKEKYLGMKKTYRNLLSKVPGGSTLLRFSRKTKDAIRRMLIPTTIFENMGFTYFGPVDGHDTEKLISLLKIARDMHRPVLVHVMTQKGKGYKPAEEHPKLFHGVGKFNAVTGEVDPKNIYTFSEAFGDGMCSLAEENSCLCAITAAMPGGTGLLKFKEQFPQRLFDVGIAEEHAVSMAGGLAKQGMIPVVAVYSTFLQRAYDLILQDVCMLNQHVIFAVDRAGLVGEDGETHHGVFDVGFLQQAPNMQILCPATTCELQQMLTWAVKDQNGPIAIRYPRGGDGAYHSAPQFSVGGVDVCRLGKDIAVVTYGTLVNEALAAADILSGEGIDVGVVRLPQIAPLPIATLETALNGYSAVVVVEEVCSGSGIYEHLAVQLGKAIPNCKFNNIDLGHNYVTHGSVKKLYQHYSLDAEGISKYIQEVLKVEN